MKRTEILNLLSVFITPLVTIIVYVTNFSIVDIILNLSFITAVLNDEFINRINTPATKMTIDIALITILAMLLIKSFDLINIKTNINNTDRTGELYIKNNDRKSKTLEIIFNIDFKYIAIKKVIKKLGGLKVLIHKPNGVILTIKNETDFNPNTIDEYTDSSYISIDIVNILDRGVCSNEVYLLLDVEANNIIHDLNRQISAELIVDDDGMLNKCCMKIIKVLMINKEMDKHFIRIRK